MLRKPLENDQYRASFATLSNVGRSMCDITSSISSDWPVPQRCCSSLRKVDRDQYESMESRPQATNLPAGAIPPYQRSLQSLLLCLNTTEFEPSLSLSKGNHLPRGPRQYPSAPHVLDRPFLSLTQFAFYWATDSTVSRAGTNNRRSPPVSAPNLSGSSRGRW